MKRTRKSAAHNETWNVAFETGWMEAAKRAVEVAKRNGLDPTTFYTDMAELSVEAPE